MVVLALGVDAALDHQAGIGAPGERAEVAGLGFVPQAALARRRARRVAGEGDPAVVQVAVVVQLVAPEGLRRDLPVQVGAGVPHVALAQVIGVLGRRLAAIRSQFRRREEARLLGIVAVAAQHQAGLERLVKRGQEPLGADRVLVGIAARPRALRHLPGDEVILGQASAVASQRQLRLPAGEAAGAQAGVQVIAALARAEVDVAADVVQAIARIVGAAHHFDIVHLERKHHVDEALVAAVDVTGNAVDQHLDPVDIAFAIECAEARLARLGAHAGLGELDAGQLAEQFPAVGDVLVLDLVGAEHVDRTHDAGRQQRPGTLGAHPDFADHHHGIVGERALAGQGQGRGQQHRQEWAFHGSGTSKQRQVANDNGLSLSAQALPGRRRPGTPGRGQRSKS